MSNVYATKEDLPHNPRGPKRNLNIKVTVHRRVLGLAYIQWIAADHCIVIGIYICMHGSISDRDLVTVHTVRESARMFNCLQAVLYT